MWEADHTDAVFRTGHAVTIGSELFGDRAVADDDSRDGGGVVRAYEHMTWREGCGDQIRGDVVSEGRNKSSREAEETDTVRMVRMASSIKEADLGARAGQGAVREEKGGIACRTGHGSIIGVCEDGARFGVICFGEAAKQEAGGVDREYVSWCMKWE